MPLDIKAETEAVKAANRIKHRNVTRWDSIGHGQRHGHLFYYQNSLEELDDMLPVFQWDGLPEAVPGDGVPKESTGTVCYTDGSKQEEGPVGFGYVIRDGEDEYTENGHIGDRATVFQGEVFAVDRAASKLLELPGSDDIDIYIDNQAAITSLTKPECKMKSTYYCRLKLIELGHTRKVRLHWVKVI